MDKETKMNLIQAGNSLRELDEKAQGSEKLQEVVDHLKIELRALLQARENASMESVSGFLRRLDHTIEANSGQS